MRRSEQRLLYLNAIGLEDTSYTDDHDNTSSRGVVTHSSASDSSGEQLYGSLPGPDIELQCKDNKDGKYFKFESCVSRYVLTHDAPVKVSVKD
jgi:hypothetical protein